jgi:hypothetical protein
MCAFIGNMHKRRRDKMLQAISWFIVMCENNFGQQQHNNQPKIFYRKAFKIGRVQEKNLF